MILHQKISFYEKTANKLNQNFNCVEVGVSGGGGGRGGRNVK